MNAINLNGNNAIFLIKMNGFREKSPHILLLQKKLMHQLNDPLSFEWKNNLFELFEPCLSFKVGVLTETPAQLL